MISPKQNTIAIILARGGSKGIPRKNVLPVGKIPIIGRSVSAAKESSQVDDVYVSTDDKEIASVASEYGAKITDRPKELAGDLSSSEAALLHFAEIVPAEKYVFLQCTSPFTTSEDIEGAVSKYQEKGIDTVLSVTEDHGGFLCGGFTWDEQGNSVNYDYERRPRRQDMKKTYRENGAIYIMGRDGLLKYSNRLYGRVGLYHMPRQRSFEIDEPGDFSLAENHHRWLIRNGLINQ